METITLSKKFGTILVSREIGITVRKYAESFGYNVIFDLEGVNFISGSFADEVFAKGFKQYGGKTFKIRNVKDDFMKSIIKQTIVTREIYHPAML